MIQIYRGLALSTVPRDYHSVRYMYNFPSDRLQYGAGAHELALFCGYSC